MEELLELLLLNELLEEDGGGGCGTGLADEDELRIEDRRLDDDEINIELLELDEGIIFWVKS